MLPLNPSKEAFDDPPPFVATQSPAIPGLPSNAVRFVRCDHLGALLVQLLVERIAAIGAIANQVLGLHFDCMQLFRS